MIILINFIYFKMEVTKQNFEEAYEYFEKLLPQVYLFSFVFNSLQKASAVSFDVEMTGIKL